MSAALAANTPSKSSVKPKPVKPTPSKATPVKKKPIKPTRRAAAPPRQTQPSSDRYREIQQALIEKGFLDGSANGQWDQKSTEALKRFEQSQNLQGDGKIDSRALIALGLGPKREPLPDLKP